MKKTLKAILYIFLFIFLGFIGFLSYVKFALPDVGKPEDITVELTEARIERGKYLANAVCVCMDCHSTRDWNKFSGPLVEGSYGKGGEEFNQTIGFPGKFVSTNITPFGIGNWTDGELLRAITSGVNKDGKALFPIMPHPNYGKMDCEDIYSIIAYLRSLAPVEYTPERSKPDFPMNFIINGIPERAEFSQKPDSSDLLAYGKYLYSACKKTQCRIRKRQVRGLRSQKKRSLLFVNEHFSDKYNEEIGVFLPTLNKCDYNFVNNSEQKLSSRNHARQVRRGSRAKSWGLFGSYSIPLGRN